MAMGYMGYAKLGSTLLLTTGASVNLVLEPIYSSAVWGAGWYNAATTTHYADNAIRYEGSLDFELQGSSTVWNLIRDWAIEQRAYSKSLVISPDGMIEYQYTASGNYDNTGAWCQSLSFSTSQDSFVTCSANLVALTRAAADTGFSTYIGNRIGNTGGADMTAMNPLNPSGNNVDPIPYWRTNANLYRNSVSFQSDIETIEWSLDLSNNPVVLYTCNGSREPTAVLQGAIDATGSATFYHPDTVYDPISGDYSGVYDWESPYLVAEDTEFKVEISTGTGNLELRLPAVLVEGDDYSIQGQSDVTSRGFTLKGLGGKVESDAILPPLLMSQAT